MNWTRQDIAQELINTLNWDNCTEEAIENGKPAGYQIPTSRFLDSLIDCIIFDIGIDNDEEEE